jgi:hypothetical protein
MIARIGSTMGDFNRTAGEARARVGKKLGEAGDRLEKECNEVIKYLNEEVVPAVRQKSTKALRTAAVKLQELANFMEKHSTSTK